MAAYEINWSAKFVGPANTSSVKGYAVCPSGAGYDIATAANLASAGRFSGIAITERSTDGAAIFAIQYSGEVSNDITQLGPGAAQPVVIDTATGKPKRVATVLTTDYYLGQAGPDGALTLGQGGVAISAGAQESLNQSPPLAKRGRVLRTYDPRDYGAVFDCAIDTNGNITGHDDTAAFIAMQSDMPKGELCRVFWPPGLSLMTGIVDTHGVRRVPVFRNMHLEGNGGGVCAPPWPTGVSSGIVMPPFCQLKCEAGNLSDDGGSASYSDIEHLTIVQKTPIFSDSVGGTIYGLLSVISDSRVAGRYYANGMCVVYSGASGINSCASQLGQTDATGSGNKVMFRCVTTNGFTTSGSEPAAFATATVAMCDPANGGHLITDGAGTWAVECIPKDRVNSAVVTVGQRWWIPGDTRKVYECTVAGTLGDAAAFAANANYVETYAHGTFADGTATVRVIFASTVYLGASNMRIRHCTIQGGFGFSIHSESGDYTSTPFQLYVGCDWDSIEDCDFLNSGGGFAVHGTECTDTKTDNCRFFGTSLITRTSSGHELDVGDIMIWDRGLGGATHSRHYAHNGSVGYVADSGLGASPGRSGTSAGPSTFDNCRSETRHQNIIRYPAEFRGQQNAQGADFTLSNGLFLMPPRCRGIIGQETDPSSKQVNYNIQQLLAYALQYAIQAGDDAGVGRWIGTWVDKLNTTLVKAGLLIYGHGTWDANRPAPWAWGVTYGDARNTGGKPGPGVVHAYQNLGFFRGVDAENGAARPCFTGAHQRALRAVEIDYGRRVPGDIFMYPGTTYASGQNLLCVCTTAGYVGQIWSAGLSYFAESDTFAREAILVQPSTATALPNGTKRTWKLTTLVAQSGGVEPTWPGSGNFTDGVGNSWTDMGLEPTFKAFGGTIP